MLQCEEADGNPDHGSAFHCWMSVGFVCRGGGDKQTVTRRRINNSTDNRVKKIPLNHTIWKTGRNFGCCQNGKSDRCDGLLTL